jgi:hypothetical protein
MQGGGQATGRDQWSREAKCLSVTQHASCLCWWLRPGLKDEEESNGCVLGGGRLTIGRHIKEEWKVVRVDALSEEEGDSGILIMVWRLASPNWLLTCRRSFSGGGPNRSGPGSENDAVTTRLTESSKETKRTQQTSRKNSSCLPKLIGWRGCTKLQRIICSGGLLFRDRR